MLQLSNVYLKNMENKSKCFNIIPTAVLVLSLGVFFSCITSQKSFEKVPQKIEQTDSVEEFVPLHPPVIIRHPWNKKS